MVMMHNNVRVWNDGVDSLSGDKYKIEGLPPGRPARASHKSLRLKALVTALLGTWLQLTIGIGTEENNIEMEEINYYEYKIPAS